MFKGWDLSQREDGSIYSNENEEKGLQGKENETIGGEGLEGKYEVEEGGSDEEPNEEIEDNGKGETNHYQTIMQELVNNNVLELEEDTEFTGTPQEIIQLIEKTANKRANESFDKMLESLPRENAEVIKAIKNGASLEEAYELVEQDVDYDSVDFTDVNNQANLIGMYLEVLGETEDSINRKIKAYHKAGTLEEEAKDALNSLKKRQDVERKSQIEEISKRKEQDKIQQEKEIAEFEKNVLSKKDIMGFQITEQESKQLLNFISKADKEGKTEFEKKDNDDSRLLYAYFVMKGMSKDLLTKEIKKSEAFKIKSKLDTNNDKKANLRTSNYNSNDDDDSEFVPISQINFPFN